MNVIEQNVYHARIAGVKIHEGWNEVKLPTGNVWDRHSFYVGKTSLAYLREYHPEMLVDTEAPNEQD